MPIRESNRCSTKPREANKENWFQDSYHGRAGRVPRHLILRAYHNFLSDLLSFCPNNIQIQTQTRHLLKNRVGLSLDGTKHIY
jgi:hypothetical protein